MAEENVYVNMKIQNLINGWEDACSTERLEMVFENRNKAYGAYRLRQRQGQNQVLAMAAVLGLVLMLVAANKLVANPGKLLSTEMKKPISEPLIEYIEYELQMPENEDNKSNGGKAVSGKGAAGTIRIGADLGRDFDPNGVGTGEIGAIDGVDFGLFDQKKLGSDTFKWRTNDGNGLKKIDIQLDCKLLSANGDLGAYLQQNLKDMGACDILGVIELEAQIYIDRMGVAKLESLKGQIEDCELFAKEIEQLVEQSVWKPAMKNGKTMAARKKIPILLRIE